MARSDRVSTAASLRPGPDLAPSRRVADRLPALADALDRRSAKFLRAGRRAAAADRRGGNRHRGWCWAWALAPAERRRTEPPWHLLIGVALCVLFAVAYPVATSGLFGGGTDRADALDVTDAALLAGRPVYDTLTYLGNPPTPLPGAVLLAAPFHLIGSGGVAERRLVHAALRARAAPRRRSPRRGGLPGDLRALLPRRAAGLRHRQRLRHQRHLRDRLGLGADLAGAGGDLGGARSRLRASSPAPCRRARSTSSRRRSSPRRCCSGRVCAAHFRSAPASPSCWRSSTDRCSPTIRRASRCCCTPTCSGFWPRWLHATVAIPALSLAIAGSAFFVGTGRGRLWLLSAISLAPMVVPLFVFVALRRGLGPWLVIVGGYTLPLALFGGLWLLRAPQARSPSEPASAALAPAPR